MSEPDEWPAEVLKTAKPLSLMWFPEAPGAVALAASVAADIEDYQRSLGGYRRGAKRMATLTDATGAVIAGLFLAWSGADPKPAFKAAHEPYFSGARVSFDSFVNVKDGLEALGLIAVKQGIRGPKGFGFFGHSARMAPTAALLERAVAHGVTPDNIKLTFKAKPCEATPKLPPDLVEVRTMRGLNPKRPRRDSKVVRAVPEGEQGRRIREEVERVNAELAEHKFNGCRQPRLRRVFTTLSERWDGNWWLGGRWYAVGPEGVYQRLPESLRAAILVDGEETVELDVSASQLTLLMGMLCLERPSGGLYDGLHGVSRAAAKQWVVQTIGNGRPVKNWRDDVAAEVRAVPIKTVEEALLSRFPFLRDPSADVMPHWLTDPRLRRKALPHRMMAVEAGCITEAMRTVWREAPGAAALPVHDSLIVARRHEAVARRAIEEAYAKVCQGVVPVVKRKAPGEDVTVWEAA